MLCFPHSKINLGLNVTEKRADGFHNLETVFYPVKWTDALEILPSKNQEPFTFTSSGLSVSGSVTDNIIFKAWKLVSENYTLPPIRVHLHKNIPMGAGIGGGSADAAFFLRLISQQFNLRISDAEKQELAAKLGSDCPFFIQDQPKFATGRGEIFSDISIDLSRYYILLIYPSVHSNTKDAFAGLRPKKSSHDLKKIIETSGPEEWKHKVSNDFEETIFKKYPLVAEIKEQLYRKGALYASMSGSGSTVYGIFQTRPDLPANSDFKYYLQLPHP